MKIWQKYVLDSNIFIAAHRTYYAMDIVPGFWEKLLENARIDKICSVKQVYDELQKGKDPEDRKSPDILAQWAKNEFKPYFHDTKGEAFSMAYSKIINWASSENRYSAAATAEFASVCDSWICAYCLANHYVLATNEKKINMKSKVSIPDLCLEFGIEYVDTFEMMRRLKIQLL